MQVKDLCARHQHKSSVVQSNNRPEQDTQSVLKPSTGDESARGEVQPRTIMPRETGNASPAGRKVARHPFGRHVVLSVSAYLNNVFSLTGRGGERERLSSGERRFHFESILQIIQRPFPPLPEYGCKQIAAQGVEILQTLRGLPRCRRCFPRPVHREGEYHAFLGNLPKRSLCQRAS